MQHPGLTELFISRAEAVSARVRVVADEAEAKAVIAGERAGGRSVGVARAALGIAETGTCVVETDGEEVRLAFAEVRGVKNLRFRAEQSEAYRAALRRHIAHERSKCISRRP